MRNPYLLFFFALSCAVLYASTCPVFAEVPASAKIVFSSWRGGNLDIYLMNPDGSEEERLTHHLARDGGPKWSPTGEQILFSSDRDGAPGDWDLYLMDADGSNVRRVFEKETYRTSHTWSPDGKQIAYSRGEQGKSFIYIAPIDGKKEERVALGSQPTWSPDGHEIGPLNRPRRITLLNLKTENEKFLPFPDGRSGFGILIGLRKAIGWRSHGIIVLRCDTRTLNWRRSILSIAMAQNFNRLLKKGSEP